LDRAKPFSSFIVSTDFAFQLLKSVCSSLLSFLNM